MSVKIDISKAINNALLKKDGIYFIDGHEEFGYSDGSVIERYIEDAIISCDDITSDSCKLENHIKDWPTRYHLSRERSYAFQALNISKSTNVVEIGSGCGAITRLLGERAGTVLALEGSPRRARITRERTKDLDNVEVLCAPFSDVVFTAKFDMVVCNGVLEYSSMFVDHDSPHEYFIELLSNILDVDGSLIVAIENQFGLRYFSSGREEHTGIMFDGLEGYSRRPLGPKTFGNTELKNIISNKFKFIDTLLPLPDYKFPNAIIRSSLLQYVNCSELFSDMAWHNFGGHVVPKMHDRLVTHEIEKNKTLEFFSNSYFIVAGNNPTKLFDEHWMGQIFSTKRKEAYCTKTKIYLKNGKDIWVSKSLYNDANKYDESSIVEHNLGSESWVNGVSIHTLIVKAMMGRNNNKLHYKILDPVKTWWNEISINSDNSAVYLENAVIDYNWQNSILNNNTVVFIDNEWIYKDKVDSIWLLYRVITKFCNVEHYYVHRWDRTCRYNSAYSIMKAVSKITGVKFSFFSIISAIKKEDRLMSCISNKGKDDRLILKLLKFFTPIYLFRIKSLIKHYQFLYLSRFRRVVSKFKT